MGLVDVMNALIYYGIAIKQRIKSFQSYISTETINVLLDVVIIGNFYIFFT